MIALKNLAEFRIRRGYSQQQLADKVNVRKQAISNYELGKRAPDYETLKLIAKALDTTPNELMAYQSAEDGFTPGERLQDYMTAHEDSANALADLLGLSLHDLVRVFDNELNLTKQQAQLAANRYHVDINMFYDTDESVINDYLPLLTGLNEENSEKLKEYAKMLLKLQQVNAKAAEP